uniref:Uncharacterized protein n=1 Tax=Eutreptiella gymnastica TaxID=73025 RepID=A0A7S4FV86_9EUGL|mmetsp:Transcript_22985/g.36574  ORF Transcript_22985/g.36574 Transcript_22985/m.36574 type:complete len:107 (+) Transcript_22985:85-405(+)
MWRLKLKSRQVPVAIMFDERSMKVPQDPGGSGDSQCNSVHKGHAAHNATHKARVLRPATQWTFWSCPFVWLASAVTVAVIRDSDDAAVRAPRCARPSQRPAGGNQG